MENKVIVIGSGIGGLSSALFLRKKGYEVLVIEKNDQPGGKLAQIRSEFYRFDTGPSLFTMPEMVDELFIMFNKKPEDYFTYKKLNNICRYFYDDKTIINSWSDLNRFEEEIQEIGIEKGVLKKYLKSSEDLYNLTADVFLFNSFHKLKNFNSPEAKRIAKNPFKLDAFTKLHRRNSKHFKNKYLTQLFDRYATYNGSSPYKTPATLKIISHLEHNIGAFFPEKGMYSIVDALYKLALEEGIEFKFNTKADEIVYENNKVRGIKSTNVVLNATYVVSNSDIYFTYKHLLPKIKTPFNVTMPERSSSAMIFYWGISKKFNQLDVHNILFSANYKKEFDFLFKKKLIYEDPTVYIFISSKIVPEDAPAEGENWFVMVNAPENNQQDWDIIKLRTRKNIIRKIKAILDIDIEPYIEYEEVADPVSIEATTLSYKGSLYGNSSNSSFSAFLRHANFSRKIENLYFTGGSVHPGGGIPLCIASAKIVSKEFKDLNT